MVGNVTLDPDRPIYPRAPLKLVALELRFSPQPRLDDPAVHEQVFELLRHRLPIMGAPPFMELELGPTPRPAPRGLRLLDRDRTTTVTLTGEALTVETSRYERYETFVALLGEVVSAVHGLVEIASATRIGLRYIDEIALLGVTGIDGWRPWINDDLLIGGMLDGYKTTDYRAGMTVEVARDQTMSVGFGLVSEPLVNPNGPLRIADSPDGEYFLLDIDSSWTAPPERFLEFSVDEMLSRCERLHDPIRDVFERAITDRLREHILLPLDNEEQS